jgi:alpha-mannosidase
MLTALVLALCLSSRDDSILSTLEQLVPQIDRAFTVPIAQWRFSRPDTPGGERPDLDDRSWQVVAPGFSWQGENTNVWFRTHLSLPSSVGGQSVAGHAVRLQLGMDDDGELYVDGRLREAFHWDEGVYTLAPRASGNETFDIALRGINGPGDGQLRSANLVFDILPELRRYVNEARFVQQLESAVGDAQRSALASALSASTGEIRSSDCSLGSIDRLRTELSRATNELVQVASITKAADIYYVGHAHIDMNWLWTWPETIDVCHRTWNSAMNLMDEFPDFAFVQSQPGAYLPIQSQFPDEFKRMQEERAKGQWDPVGALWDESDTNIPSGEGLARSLFIGQRFFKNNFGTYATTGWLPDSFGHSWQLPQLYRLAGIDSFYHMRGGNGIQFGWWEGPDGSRILKANTSPYNSDVQLGQLVEPWNEAKRTGMAQTLVVFGVGDHGGGPTREEILTLEQFKHDPVLPNVHLAGIDGYFKELSQRRETKDLPVIDHDLQYVNVGCYTTHADIKKALRDSENSLYSSEALTSLAAMGGSSYPTDAFNASWAVSAFAQFHDIACGSAIHSTYDWMLDQLRPAIRSSRSQTAQALEDLTARVDTRGPSNQAIVVWNPLSFTRDDVVRVNLANAESFHSVVDRAGQRYAAQADSNGSLIFVARQVPGFGHRVYFASHAPGPSDHLSVKQSPGEILIDSARLAAHIDTATGAMTQLRLKDAAWSVFGSATDANTFQVLGDSANAWEINYTGENHRLSDAHADVALVESGPVFARVAVVREFGVSRYRQDVIVYGGLDRVDVPTDVEWHEHGKLLKVCLPVDVNRGVARCQIPYGSIGRPTNGQECPGQKWMDYSDEQPGPALQAQTLDLVTLLNSDSRGNFDTVGWGYPPFALPEPGVHRYGDHQVPFEMRTGVAGGHDNVSCQGQTIQVPPGSKGDTLFLLGAAAPSGVAGGIRFNCVDGSSQTGSVEFNDWVLTSFDDNESAALFPYRFQAPAAEGSGKPHFWIASVKAPTGELRSIRLPNEPHMHVFAATLATLSPDIPVHGLSVLNDAKYGFDVSNNLFRLTLLRSSNDPDPNPDEGRQAFTYSLYPHSKDWREALSEQHGLALNIPLEACATTNHPASGVLPEILIDSPGSDVVAGALKHAEDGQGYVLRVYETQGRNSQVTIDFRRPVSVAETDILERPLKRHALSVSGSRLSFSVGHDQIVTLHFSFSDR